MNDDTTQISNTTDNTSGAPIDNGSAPTLGLGNNPAAGALPEDNQPQSNPTFTPMPEDSPAPAGEANPAVDDFTPLLNNDSASEDLGELSDIKKQALSKLAPIVDKLDQTPEEKYRTLMMLIQSSDDQTMIKAAYEAASQITDEAKKAEALLGVVNEIEYFSQSDKKN